MRACIYILAKEYQYVHKIESIIIYCMGIERKQPHQLKKDGPQRDGRRRFLLAAQIPSGSCAPTQFIWYKQNIAVTVNYSPEHLNVTAFSFSCFLYEKHKGLCNRPRPMVDLFVSRQPTKILTILKTFNLFEVPYIAIVKTPANSIKVNGRYPEIKVKSNLLSKRGQVLSTTQHREQKFDVPFEPRELTKCAIPKFFRYQPGI